MSPSAAYALGVVVGALFVVSIIFSRRREYVEMGCPGCAACEPPAERTVYVLLEREPVTP